MKSFASDNYSGASPEILQAIIEANVGHVPSYGEDLYTQKAVALFKKVFGEEISVYFVGNGTAANTLGLKTVMQSHHSIICADSAHIMTQEVGAPVHAIGCSILSISNNNGKITAAEIEETYLNSVYWGRHTNLPKVVSIAQSTEFGTVYTKKELSDISEICKKYNLIFHVDGCRLANAAVALNASFKELTVDVGVDVLSFGGAKNGLMFGEAILFLRKDLDIEFQYIQKQELQLLSKMRFLSAQFIPYLEQEIYYKNAKQANDMCEKLANLLEKKYAIQFAYPPQTNQIFAYFPESFIKASQHLIPYYIWNKKLHLVRLVTSFDTTEEDVDQFIGLLEQAECN